jgi:hypothetical protein
VRMNSTLEAFGYLSLADAELWRGLSYAYPPPFSLLTPTQAGQGKTLHSLQAEGREGGQQASQGGGREGPGPACGVASTLSS